MKTSSCKAKGRRCAAETRALLLIHAPDLAAGDILVTPSGVTGPDLYLSPRARQTYPLAIECKNVEALNIWKALEQAESHAAREADIFPILFFKRNQSKLYVSLSAEDFMELVK